jgi:glycosyltransferase involved in cell wall biosynthesis
MQVFVVNDFAHVNGGSASVAIASAVALAQRGHIVTFFSAVGPVDPRLSGANIDVVCTGQCGILEDPRRLRAAWQGIWNTTASRGLYERLASAHPENTIVHLHSWTKALSASVVRVACELDFKTVCTLHDYFVACPNGGFFDYRSLSHCHRAPLSFDCVARNCDSRSYAHKLWRVARQYVQLTAGRLPQGVNAFIVLSQLSRDLLRPYMPAHAQTFEIPNPIDIPREDPVEVECNRQFLMIGRLAPEKGGVLFARAARECGVDATFVGNGLSRSEIESEYPAAMMTGWLPQRQVCEYFGKARALVLPSLWYEARPLAVMEAAARGVPAIVSDGCGGAESVADGITGILFKNGDVQSLSAALRTLSDRNMAIRLGRNAYERYWADPPSLDRHVSLLEQAYRSMLNRSISDDRSSEGPRAMSHVVSG